MAAEGGDAVGVPRSKPTIKHRFSSLRYNKVVKMLNPIQRGYILKHDLHHLLNIPAHLMIPLSLLQWLARRMSTGEDFQFRHKGKVIQFTKGMVDKVFGFPNGSIPFVLESDDPVVLSEVESIRKQYLNNDNKIPLKLLESILLGSNNELVFMRSFVLYFISSILCPSTYNFVNPKYFFSLRDSDMVNVGKLDFGQLCLTHLFREIQSWGIKLFYYPGDVNREMWIGGCLPLLAVVYLDFINLSGNPGNFDYGLPRMSHIKNEDFIFLESVDRNIYSRKGYGILPIRHVSLTPYAGPLMIFAPQPQLAIAGVGNEGDQLEDIVPEIPQPVGAILADANEGDHLEDMVPEIPEYIGPILADTNEGDHLEDMVPEFPQPIGVILADANEGDHREDMVPEILEPIGPILADDNEADHLEDMVPELAQPIGAILADANAGDHLEDMVPEILEPIGPILADDNDDQDIIDIEIDAPTVDISSFSDASHTSFVVENTVDQSGGIVRYEEMIEPSAGQSSFSKPASPDRTMPSLDIDADIEAFFTKYVCKKFFSRANNPVVIEIGVHSVKYDTFRKSFKARAVVDDDTMTIFAQIFNDKSKFEALSKPYIKKFMFSTYTTGKLFKDPSIFEKNWVAGEFRRIMDADFEISSMDIFHFPNVICNRWVLISVNPLFKTINFFDPGSVTSESLQAEMMSNLACNLNCVFKELNVRCSDFEAFQKFNPQNYPKQSLLFDDGIFVMLYSENWMGKYMKNFTKEMILKYKKRKSFDMFYCIQNEVAVEYFEKKKKRRKA